MTMESCWQGRRLDFGPGHRLIVVAGLIAAILGLHYLTLPDKAYHHVVYRMLFYLPLILGGFWFGLRGALSAWASISLLYLPFVLQNWEGLTVNGFEKLLEGLLFLVIAMVVGCLAERERRERRALLESERLAAVGRTMAEVAHDMKTPLLAIGGFAVQLRRQMEGRDDHRKKLDLIIKEAGRLEALVRDMLDFSRSVELRPVEIQPASLIRETMELLVPLAEEAGVRVRLDLPCSLPAVFADEGRMKQVLMNLLTNAIQASPRDQEVTLKTVPGNDSIIIAVTDCGCGIPDDHAQLIFQPFFSTKRAGTGLGLAIIRRIVEAHGGEITFFRNPEQGMTFQLTIPSRGKRNPGLEPSGKATQGQAAWSSNPTASTGDAVCSTERSRTK